MTRDDIHSCHYQCDRPICVAVREAVKAERAACAEFADAYAEKGHAVAEWIAVAIRARGDK